MEYITFVNDTPFPVIVETWENFGKHGLSRMVNVTVNEYQELNCIFLPKNMDSFTFIPEESLNVLYSITGEWHINSFFTNSEISDKWKKHKLPQTVIGKFRSSPCMSGNYSWMFIDKYFNMFYDKKNKKIHFFLKPLEISESEYGSP